MFFTAEERERVRTRVLELARADERVVAAAVVGSEAGGRLDRFSDIDLTFAVRHDAALADVIEDWSAVMRGDFAAEHLFDLPAGASIYRVFLLPSALQVDLSFTPATEFGARGPEFRVLWGDAPAKPPTVQPDAFYRFGLAALFILHARVCLERGKVWQAEYWISAIRDEALALACLARGLPTREGRGFDRLPVDVLRSFEPAFVRSLQPSELFRALGATVEALLAVTEDERAGRLAPLLRELAPSGAARRAGGRRR